MGWTITASTTTRRWNFLVATTHLRGFTFFAATATRMAGRNIFSKATTHSGSLGISATVSTFREIWMHLGPRKLFAGHHVAPKATHWKDARLGYGLFRLYENAQRGGTVFVEEH